MCFTFLVLVEFPPSRFVLPRGLLSRSAAGTKPRKESAQSSPAPGETVSGSPAFGYREWLRAVTAFPKLPDLLRTMRRLEERLTRAESSKA